MSVQLLSRSLSLLRRNGYLLWLGLGMSLSSLFATGWQLWAEQFFVVDFSQLLSLQAIEPFLFEDEIVHMQQLIVTGLLLLFGQLVLVWLAALVAEAGIISAVVVKLDSAVTLPMSLSRAARLGRTRLGRFLAIDLLIFFPWFLIALLMFIIILVLILALASYAAIEPAAGVVFATVGIGLVCIPGLTILLLPVGLFSYWFRLLTFREAVLRDVSGRTAVRNTWHHIRQNFGHTFFLVITVWGGQAVVFAILNLMSGSLLSWLTPLTNSATIPVQVLAWIGLLLLTGLFWLIRGGITTIVSIIWTIAYVELSTDG